MSFPTGPTPPPPPVYPASVPLSPEPTGPGLSEPQRLLNTIIAPRKTFEDLKRNPSWWVPWLITLVCGLAFSVVALQKMDIGRFVQQQNERSPSAQRRLEQATPEQRAQGLAIQITITKVSFYVIPFFGLLWGLIVAAVLMATFNFLMGAEIPFQRAMGVVFYSSFTGIFGAILLIISFLVSADPSTIDLGGNPMPTNPAFFMDPQGNKVLYSLASALDIFKIWWCVLLGLGFATVSNNKKPSVGAALTTVFIAYGILVMIGLGIKLAFS